MTGKNGFTLVEMIVAFSIAGILFCSLLLACGQEIRSQRRLIDSCEKEQIRNVLFSRVMRELRLARENPPLFVWKDGKVGIKEGKTTQYLTDVGQVGSFSLNFLPDGFTRIEIDGTAQCIRQ